jgi:hypothetical protein
MNRWPPTRAFSPRRGRKRRTSGRLLFFVTFVALLLLFLGFKLWEIGMAILVYIYLDWCFKS